MQPNPEPARRRTPPMWADGQLAALRDRRPGWHPWYVHNYPAGDYTWCGKPEGALTGELQAHSPEALTKQITEYETTLDGHIAETRAKLATLPPSRPETPDQRKVLNARLQAQLQLRARRTADTTAHQHDGPAPGTHDTGHRR
jgi:hypothetical protein